MSFGRSSMSSSGGRSKRSTRNSASGRKLRGRSRRKSCIRLRRTKLRRKGPSIIRPHITEGGTTKVYRSLLNRVRRHRSSIRDIKSRPSQGNDFRSPFRRRHEFGLYRIIVLNSRLGRFVANGRNRGRTYGKRRRVSERNFGRNGGSQFGAK